MRSTSRRRNRILLDSVVNGVAAKRMHQYQVLVNKHKSGPSQLYEKSKIGIDLNRLASSLDHQENDVEDTDLLHSDLYFESERVFDTRKSLKRSFSDPSGLLDLLDIHRKEINTTAQSIYDNSNLMSKPEAQSLLETAGEVAWMHFMSEYPRRLAKHRGSDPVNGSVFSANRKLEAEVSNENGVLLGLNPHKIGVNCAVAEEKNSTTKDTKGNGGHHKRRLSRGLIWSQTSKLPPITESRAISGLTTSNISGNELHQEDEPLIAKGTNSWEDNKAHVNHCESKDHKGSSENSKTRGKEVKVSNKKVVFEDTSDSSHEKNSSAGMKDRSLVVNKPSNDTKKSKGGGELKHAKGGVGEQRLRFLHDQETLKISTKASTGLRLRKIGRSETPKQPLNTEPKTEECYAPKPRRRFSLETIAGFDRQRRRISTETPSGFPSDDSESEENDAAMVEMKPLIFNTKNKDDLDRKMSEASFQAVYTASRPSIANLSGTLLTFERQYGNKDETNLSSGKNARPMLPERMVSFSSKVNLWRMSGAGNAGVDVPRPRARTSASLPSLMDNLHWPSPPGTTNLSNNRLNQKLLLQQQQFALQRRFFRRKSSYIGNFQGAGSSLRRQSSLRQGGENLLQSLLKRPKLRRTLSQGDFSKIFTRKTFMPLVKFRRVVKMVLILLKATYSDREGGQRRERYLSLWASVLGGKFSNSRRAYEMYGISFDPQEFKANTEVQVSTEAKAILSLEPSQRSPQQLRQVLASLRQAVDEFSEFPITMQESLARVGRYEHFEAKRVIIRQGHLAENFYFILSGTAVVIIMDTDKHTSEQTARTAAFLGKGKSFGELALMHQSRRTATVTCQEDVELLSVSREDFLHIFMHTVERDAEPEHVRFLRSLHILRDWPVEVLPTDNPLVLVFHYVRRGIVLCKDSNTSEWLFVIKSGSCRVIKALKEVRAQGTTPRLRAMPNGAKHKKHGDESRHGKTSIEPSETSDSMTFPLLPPLSPVQSDTKNTRRYCSRKQILPGLDVSAEKLERVSQEHFQVLNSIHRRFHIPVDQNSPDSSRSSSSDGESQSNMQDRPLSDGYHNNAQSTVFVEVQTLQPGDIHGLEPCVFRSMGTPTSTSLVSCGAELIMINRKFFMDNTSEQMRKRIRREIRPLPSEETLQSQLQTKISWKAYTQHTLSTTLQLQRKQAARRACPMIQS